MGPEERPSARCGSRVSRKERRKAPSHREPRGSKLFFFQVPKSGNICMATCLPLEGQPGAGGGGEVGGQAVASSPRLSHVWLRKASTRPLFATFPKVSICNRAVHTGYNVPPHLQHFQKLAIATGRCSQNTTYLGFPTSCRISETSSEEPLCTLPSWASAGLGKHPPADEKTRNVGMSILTPVWAIARGIRRPRARCWRALYR